VRVFGGVMFALERERNWADFLNLLPPSRAQILRSKLFLMGICFIVSIVPNIAVETLAQAMEDQIKYHFDDTRYWPWLIDLAFVPITVLTSALFCLGVAWFFSSLHRSAVICAGIAIVAFGLSAVTLFGFAPMRWNVGSLWTFAEQFWIVFTFSVGIAALIGGSIHYLRRVEP
jgi:hypothetical protein